MPQKLLTPNVLVPTVAAPRGHPRSPGDWGGSLDGLLPPILPSPLVSSARSEDHPEQHTACKAPAAPRCCQDGVDSSTRLCRPCHPEGPCPYLLSCSYISAHAHPSLLCTKASQPQQQQHLGPEYSWLWVYPARCRTFSSVPGLYLLDANRTSSQLCQPKIPPDPAKLSLGAKHPQVRTTARHPCS